MTRRCERLVAILATLTACYVVAAAGGHGLSLAPLPGGATLLKRADRNQFFDAEDQPPAHNRQLPIRARSLSDLPSSSGGGLFSRPTGQQRLDFGSINLPAFPGTTGPLPAPLASAAANASASQCDIFTQTSTVQCGNTAYSDLPSFACCTGISDASSCGTSAAGGGNCTAPLLPACCFARNQDVNACTARSSANTCGGSVPVQACCADTVCKVGRYAKPYACDSSSTSACCPP